MKKILVAYVSKTGTTAEVAAEIGKTLDGAGWQADIRRMSEVSSLEDYSAVVLGAPINGMRWHAEAAAFAADHREALRGLPAACFYLSYIMFAGGRESLKGAIRKSMEELASSFGARSVGAFGGRIQSPLPAPIRFAFGTEKGGSLDKRDWDVIRSWASEIAGLLGA